MRAGKPGKTCTRFTDCTNATVLTLIFYSIYPRCSHWGKWAECTQDPLWISFFYKFFWIYNYFQSRKLKKHSHAAQISLGGITLVLQLRSCKSVTVLIDSRGSSPLGAQW